MKSRIAAALALVVSLACCAFGQSVHQIAVPDSSGYPKVVTEANPLPVVGEFEIGSITVDTSIVPVTEWQDQVISLSAGVASLIISEVAGSRRFIEITPHVATIEYWVRVGGTAAIGTGRPVTGSIYLEVPKDKSVSLIASQTLSVTVIEGGY